MFVGGSVEDQLRTVLGEDASDRLLIANAGSTGDKIDMPMGTKQLLLDGEERRFAPFDQDQPGWILFGNLTAQLTADAAPRPRDHDDFAFDQSVDPFMVQSHRLAPE